MTAPPDPQPSAAHPQVSRPPPAWLVAWLRTDFSFCNWLHEHAAGFAKTWFEWLNWILILAALHVVATKYHSLPAAIVLWTSYMLIFYYFHSLYWRSAPVAVDPLTGVSRRSIASWVFAAIPSAAFVLLARSFATAVARVAP